MTFVSSVSPPKYSILILGFKSLQYLENCFESLLKTSGPSHEILFLDNQSPEPEGEWIRSHFDDPRIRIFHSARNLFFAGGVNYLADRAQGEFLILLNPDTHVEVDWLEVLEVFLSATGYEGAALDVLEETTRRADDRFYLDPFGLTHFVPVKYAKSPSLFTAGGSGMVIRRNIFFEVGGMDEDFKMYFEEVDLCWRVNLKGYRIGYATGSIVHHIRGGSASKSLFLWNRFRARRNRIWSYFKNAGSLTLIVFIPTHLLICLIRIIGGLLTGRFKNAIAEAAAVSAAFFHFRIPLSKRKAIQKGRRVSDLQLMQQEFLLLPTHYLGRLWKTVFPFQTGGNTAKN